MRRDLLPVLACVYVVGCSSPTPPHDAATDVPPTGMDAQDAATDAAGDAPTTTGDGDAASGPRLSITSVTTRFVTREHMLASFEMQQSGEPLAQAMGRNLAGYNRDLIPPDIYTDPLVPDAGGVLDIVGFSSAIESYEYSKQPMNNIALESGAGTSLEFGPLVDPTGATGAAALTPFVARVQHFATSSHVGVPTSSGGRPGYVAVPPPVGDATNPLGWRGLEPTVHPFRSFDPSIVPANGVSGACSITPGDGDDGRAGTPAHPVGDYECDFQSLHLTNRDAQVEHVISPGSSGWAGWKYALWITNYLQVMHDPTGNSIGAIAAADAPNVGSVGNTIVGTTSNPIGTPGPGAAGTFLGSSDIEGFQGALMIDALDNGAQQWLTQLSTTDGATLSGFASLTDALAYDYTRPLRWMPTGIAVTETSDSSGFPRPATFAIATSDSQLFDLLGLVGAYAQLYALTDHGNHDVGGTQAAQVYFDGDPFPADDGVADGESTPHDRWLAMLKFAFVTLDRVHRDPASNLLVDTTTFAGSTPARGATVRTTSVAYTLASLRAMRRSLSSQLTLYSNSVPDTAVTSTPLDSTSWAGAPGGATLAGRLNALIAAHADLLYTHLTDDSGNALPGWNVVTMTATAPAAGDTALESHAAAVRGLLEGFLATGDSRYRDRATAVYMHMESTLFDPALRIYRTDVGNDTIAYTPLRFALVQASLREMYKLVASRPGHEAMGTMVQDRIARLNTLVLNGWDDRNGNGTVDWPAECLQVVSGLPRGGLQMAERALTGELGMEGRLATSDRDHDCVPDISYVRLPAALASQVVFTVTP